MDCGRELEGHQAGLPPGVQEYYADHAEVLAERYESLTFEAVYQELLSLLPALPARAADIGAGTGRDAAALTRLGYSVTAVEPVSEMREAAALRHQAVSVWLGDALPKLSLLEGTFDLLLLSAVWMHLTTDERPRAMARLSELLAPGGRMVVTLRHGPPPRDRRMFDVSALETVELALRYGLRLVYQGGGGDRLGRDEVHWSQLVFEKTESGIQV
ncbi:class I SAM-dependent methyltransferase [Streptomyces albipurpureus]|uniref:Class I SAM-dependent methyltransferase n=1 Tax=Streptomyces albipurpureus TaxID=2897419 RepID=A0ABT0UVW4_9ACTN|nr:class I SAM-dependent methyltransferase [Streptomyces sp. CWNU-1]MCM2392733.1 class I SAM-dependent methyltransferase [Streptomyces sp. CWNU-1]